jgi:hypothetical protein
MKTITTTFVPTEKLSISGESSKTYPYQVGQPLPVVGEVVTFVDPHKSFTVKSRSFHYVNEETLQVFFSIDR